MEQPLLSCQGQGWSRALQFNSQFHIETILILIERQSDEGVVEEDHSRLGERGCLSRRSAGHHGSIWVRGIQLPSESIVDFNCLLRSGKTTLLDILADRVSSGEIKGSVKVNGRPRGSTFKHFAAYVQQGDMRLSALSAIPSKLI